MKDKQAPALRDDTWIIQLHAYALVDPNPQTPYQGTGCPVIELKGQREHLGGPPVVRATGEWDQVRDEAFGQSSECQDLVYERTESKVMDVKAADQLQRCKPRKCRVDTGTKKTADCQKRNSQLILGMSCVGPDGLVAPAAGKRANQIRLFQPQATASLAGTRRLATENRRAPVPAGDPVSPGSAQATEAQGPGLSSPASPPG